MIGGYAGRLLFVDLSESLIIEQKEGSFVISGEMHGPECIDSFSAIAHDWKWIISFA